MGVIRVERNRSYITLSKCHLRDPRLSLRAKGLMSWMLSLPDDWDYSVAGMARCCVEGREAVRKVVKELEEAGYLERIQARGGGRFEGYDYVLREQSSTAPPSPGNLGDGEAPSPGNLGTGFLGTDFPPQRDNVKEITENNPPKPPRGRREKAACEWEPDMFERFWKLYPRGEDKAKARFEWDEIKPDHALMQRMSAALKRQLASEEWRRGIGIPYACRWLSNRRWEAADKPDLGTVSGSDTREEAIPWI